MPSCFTYLKFHLNFGTSLLLFTARTHTHTFTQSSIRYCSSKVLAIVVVEVFEFVLIRIMKKAFENFNVLLG